jgi:SAM-dependent methyltransferase
LPRLKQTAYRRFWSDVGADFPDLAGAASTDYYFEDEVRLFAEYLPDLAGIRILKTDLWDEAKNTRILRWAAEQGAQTWGIDLSPPIVEKARRNFLLTQQTLACATSDVRGIPFRDAEFDAVYSMGTVEHFDETEQALAEIFRVLRPGGTAIIGVPNRHDPFLRPLLVAVLYRLGLYGYGYEKSYSRKALREMLCRAGFSVTAETGILFIPGWLRMLDLVCLSWCRPLARLTGLAVRPFAWLSRRFPPLRRHGYLLVMAATRPHG